MTQSAATIATTSPHALPAILFAGLACGILDISAACIVYGSMFHVGPIRILHNVASGLLGRNAYTGGLASAAVGLLCHFVIAFGAATVFFLLARAFPVLLNQALLSGALYGIAVYFFMNRVVVPVSKVAKTPFSFKMMIIGVIIHIFCVGLPIALVTRRFSGN
jgi:uncharacterized membrane protein YagU involved in acid resistance